MESVEERLRRDWLEIKDDRPDRGLWSISQERRDRLYSPALIGDTEPEEPSSYFGFKRPIYIPQENLEWDESGFNHLRIFSDAENIDAAEVSIAVLGENITIKNSNIGVVQTLGNFMGEQLYPAKFENCSFIAPTIAATPSFQNCTFIRCDFDGYVDLILQYYRDGIFNKVTVRTVLENIFFHPSNIFINCKTSSLDDYPELDLDTVEENIYSENYLETY